MKALRWVWFCSALLAFLAGVLPFTVFFAPLDSWLALPPRQLEALAVLGSCGPDLFSRISSDYSVEWWYPFNYCGAPRTSHPVLAAYYRLTDPSVWVDVLASIFLWYSVIGPLFLGAYSLAVMLRRPKGVSKGQGNTWPWVLENLYKAGIVRVSGLMLVFLGVVCFHETLSYRAFLWPLEVGVCGLGFWLALGKLPEFQVLSRREKMLSAAGSVASLTFAMGLVFLCCKVLWLWNRWVWKIFYPKGKEDYDALLRALAQMVGPPTWAGSFSPPWMASFPGNAFPALVFLAFGMAVASALGLVVLRLWPRLNRFFRLASKVGWLCFSASILLMWLSGTFRLFGLPKEVVDFFALGPLGPLALFGLGLVVSSAAAGVLWPVLRSLHQRRR
jgi:hypothetical protein